MSAAPKPPPGRGTPPPKKPRSFAFRLFKAMFWMSCILVIAAVSFAVWANWGKDHDRDGQADGFTMRLRDADWWLAGKDRANEVGERGLKKADELTADMRKSLWKEGGWMDRAESWLKTQGPLAPGAPRDGAPPVSGVEGAPVTVPPPRDLPPPTVAGPTGGDVPPPVAPMPPAAPPTAANPPAAPMPPVAATPPAAPPAQPPAASATPPVVITPVPVDGSAPAAPPVRGVSPETALIERQFAEAEATFRQGYERYQAGNPADGGWTKEKAQAIKDAGDRFQRVRQLLESSIETYRARPDADPATADRMEELRAVNQQLLHNAKKMTEA